MIGVVDYQIGNIASVANALTTIRAEFHISNDASILGRCSGIILPGVGAASGAMSMIHRHQLAPLLKNTGVPVLGICLGMQLLYLDSEEGPSQCLGILRGSVRKFGDRTARIPHMGWNLVEQSSHIPLMEGIGAKEYFYFAHSFYAPLDETTTAMTREGIEFSSVIQIGNVMGVQFHPEKSGPVGLKVLKNFAGLCR